jgi:tRNA threonylcarbamoyladenosine biosynthesis protein TsaE
VLGSHLRAGSILGLVGDLGAGKTALTRSIALGAGVPRTTVVNSPTFTIMNIYDRPRGRLLHLDLYRVADAEELEGIGLPDLLASGAPLVVEWFDRFPHAFPPDALVIEIGIREGTNRTLRMKAGGPLSAALLSRIS